MRTSESFEVEEKSKQHLFQRHLNMRKKFGFHPRLAPSTFSLQVMFHNYCFNCTSSGGCLKPYDVTAILVVPF